MSRIFSNKHINMIFSDTENPFFILQQGKNKARKKERNEQNFSIEQCLRQC